MSTRKKKNIMNYKFKTKPYEHQLKALEMSWERPYFAYFMEMGTGKSKVLIDNISMLYDNGKIMVFNYCTKRCSKKLARR